MTVLWKKQLNFPIQTHELNFVIQNCSISALAHKLSSPRTMKSLPLWHEHAPSSTSLLLLATSILDKLRCNLLSCDSACILNVCSISWDFKGRNAIRQTCVCVSGLIHSSTSTELGVNRPFMAMKKKERGRAYFRNGNFCYSRYYWKNFTDLSKIMR